MRVKSVKSLNRWQSMIQTIYHIMKMQAGQLEIEYVPGESDTFIIHLES